MPDQRLRRWPTLNQHLVSVPCWLGKLLLSICWVRVVIPTGRYSDSSIFRQVVVPTGRYSDKRVVIPTGRYSDRSIFRQVFIPTGRYFDKQVVIPTGRYSDIKIIVMRGLTTINSYCGDE